MKKFFQIDDLVTWKWNGGMATLIVKKLLSNNRMKVNFAEPRPPQQDWDVYQIDYEKVGSVEE